MNIIAVADTHLPKGRLSLPGFLIDELQKSDAIFHLGDFNTLSIVQQFQQYGPLYAVAGNNDTDEVNHYLPKQAIVELGQYRFGLIHGDGTKGTTLKRAMDAFSDQIRDHGVDMILFGHSHNPYLEKKGSLWIVNPGSPTDKRRNATFSYARIEAKDELKVEIVYFSP